MWITYFPCVFSKGSPYRNLPRNLLTAEHERIFGKFQSAHITCSSSCKANDLMALRGLRSPLAQPLLMIFLLFYSRHRPNWHAADGFPSFFRVKRRAVQLWMEHSFVKVVHNGKGGASAKRTPKFSDFRRAGENVAFPRLGEKNNCTRGWKSRVHLSLSFCDRDGITDNSGNDFTN